MPHSLTPALGRRRVLQGLASVTLTGAVSSARAEEARVHTPPQTEGPFYPETWTGDSDNDLVMVHGEAARALGHITHVSGRVLDASGQPIPGARVEIWQCDANGIYRHSGDTDAKRRPDAGFQGHGRMVCGPDGQYTFRTIRPVAYPGRTPHIHFAVTTPKRSPLITQMYVAGEPLNSRDGVLQRIRDVRQRDSVIVRLESADRLEAGALAGVFDIVLAG